jgi:hypothetical protein
VFGSYVLNRRKPPLQERRVQQRQAHARLRRGRARGGATAKWT